MASARSRVIGMAGCLVAGLGSRPAVAAPAYPPHAVPRLAGVTIPGLPAVTGRIRVDQFGYLPDEDKVAVIADPLKGYDAGDRYTPGRRLELRRRADGKAVFRAAPVAWNHGAAAEDSGDRGWWFDFSSVTRPGTYYIFDPSTRLRSPVFRIASDVFASVLRAAVRTYFYQREGVALQPPFAERPWVFDPELTEDRRARFVGAKDDPATERDVSGGWMDAGDTNKYPPFNAGVIHPLLYAWQENPEAFSDAGGIPESGNGLPDLLDEAKYQLDWLVKMQAADGGVFIKMGDVSYGRKVPRSLDASPRYYGPECSASTLAVAGIFAHAARAYDRFGPWRAFAADLRRRSLLAWNWYTTHPRSYDCDTGEIKSGGANRNAGDHDRMEAEAAIHLWAVTGATPFQDVIRKQAGQTRQLGEGEWSAYEGDVAESLVEYAGLDGADPALRDRIRGALARSARSAQWAPPPAADLYRAWVSPWTYHWGGCTPRANYGTGALLAATQPGVPEADRRRLRQRALDLLHAFHGVNALGAVMLSNMASLGAERSLTRIWHERFNFNTPHAANPPPGYVVGGPHTSYSGAAKPGEPDDVGWIKAQPRAKAYADFNEPWPRNAWELTEIAIYYQASYLRLLSAFARP